MRTGAFMQKILVSMAFLMAAALAPSLAQANGAERVGPRGAANVKVYSGLLPRLGQVLEIRVRQTDGTQRAHTGKLHDFGGRDFRLDSEWGNKITIPYLSVLKVREVR